MANQKTSGRQGSERMEQDASGGFTDRISDFASRIVDKTGDLRGDMMDRLGDLPQYGRDFAGRIDRHARANPWLHVGLVAVGGLALGYVIGRASASTGDAEVRGLREAGDLKQTDTESMI